MPRSLQEGEEAITAAENCQRRDRRAAMGRLHQ